MEQIPRESLSIHMYLGTDIEKTSAYKYIMKSNWRDARWRCRYPFYYTNRGEEEEEEEEEDKEEEDKDEEEEEEEEKRVGGERGDAVGI
ncbi:hypothetical protein M8J77_016612 [Diaphorina citri]|nr:hypothetical protein M8J77_016612 [Diaphorina citri]